MFTALRTSLLMVAVLTLITGLAYPLVITGVAQTLLPERANGSLLYADGRVVGSTLVGQSFGDPRYFWGRPSATAGGPYNAAASAGSNLGPTNPALVSSVRDRVVALRLAHPDEQATPIPVDLVTASGSGLDPHISPAAAFYQTRRVAFHRSLPEARVRALVSQHIEGRSLGILGEPRVNVLLLNLALDKVAGSGT